MLKNELRAVIFDLDGLLIDTERIAMSTFFATCREHGIEPDVEVFYSLLGGNENASRRILMENYGEDFPWESFNSFWTQKSFEETITKPVPTKPGTLGLLKYLQTTQLKKAVATSSQTEKSRKRLEMAGILHLLDFVLGGDTVSHSKPHPEIYLNTCRMLNEEPSKCLALEDSDNGVRSALSAGLAVIQVPDLVPPSEEVAALGHQIVDSLADVEIIIRRLV